MEDVNSRLKVSHNIWATMNSYEYTVICFVNICGMCLISIYFLFKIFHYSQALFIQSFEKNILPILVYGGGNFFTEVITLPVSHEEKWPLGHFIKKNYIFSTAWMSLFFAGKWPRSSSYGNRYSFLHCLRGGITNGSPLNL